MPKRLLSIADHAGVTGAGSPREALGCYGLVPDASRQFFPSGSAAVLCRGLSGAAAPGHHGVVQVQPAAPSLGTAPARCVSTEGGNNDGDDNNNNKKKQGLD